METFETCKKINSLLEDEQENEARNELIKLLNDQQNSCTQYTPLINSLIRKTGLYPYIDPDSSDWQERFIYESFKSDIGLPEQVTLHREQAFLLSRLVTGENLAVSAPTSFGKSFIIDAFITITSPKNVVIIVPTIALTDETRRRLHRKFASEYKIITTADQQLSNKNIFIFPQERAIGYADRIKELDILIIDEFYKASPKFDKERSPALLRAMLRLGEIAKQKYFLAPNITHLKDSPFTTDMHFYQLDVNTVFLEQHDLSKQVNGDRAIKSSLLLDILNKTSKKTLIYAGTYPNITELGNLFIDSYTPTSNKLLMSFSNWLSKNYDPNWQLTKLVNRGIGIHNGQLHRSLSQIQIKLFEDEMGLKNLISTSSIIEGVNTSAGNVVLWSNKNGSAKLNNFTYKNIIGRSGRMFRHFIGKIYILESPPKDTETDLELTIPESLLGSIDENDERFELTPEQLQEIINYKSEMQEFLGDEKFQQIQAEDAFQNTNHKLTLTISKELYQNPSKWRGLAYLNSSNPEHWEPILYKILRLGGGGWGAKYSCLVNFIKILSKNWDHTISEMLDAVSLYDIGIEDFFKLERVVTFKLTSLLGDINTLQELILKETSCDISTFISKTSHAFLPQLVFQLEEYGLPRTISKKIHQSGLFNFELEDNDLTTAINFFNSHSIKSICDHVVSLDEFDLYILQYFYDGITTTPTYNG